jgi:hypothetical protein
MYTYVACGAFTTFGQAVLMPVPYTVLAAIMFSRRFFLLACLYTYSLQTFLLFCGAYPTRQLDGYVLIDAMHILLKIQNGRWILDARIIYIS